MVAGHLREQNGYFQMILSWKNIDGKRKSKSISTGLPVKGNKKRAEAMLLKARREFIPDNLLENANIPFSDFLMKWLKERGRGDFYWDFYGPMVTDKENKASMFIREAVKELPSKYEIDSQHTIAEIHSNSSSLMID